MRPDEAVRLGKLVAERQQLGKAMLALWDMEPDRLLPTSVNADRYWVWTPDAMFPAGDLLRLVSDRLGQVEVELRAAGVTVDEWPDKRGS